MRQEVGKLRHQIDAQAFLFDTNMDMHPANQHAPCDNGQFGDQRFVAFLLGGILLLPVGKRVAGGGDGHEVIASRHLGHGATQAAQFFTRRGDILADARADLDLALHEFRADLILKCRFAGVHQRIGCSGERQRILVHQQVFFFDADGELRLHGEASGL